MHHRGRLISASEIGTWCYCRKAWHLQQRGYPTALTAEREAGRLYHQAHSCDLQRARRQRIGAILVMTVCILLLALFGLARMWEPK